MARKFTIRGGNGLGEVLLVYTNRFGGTTYVSPAWWGVAPQGYALAGPCSSERALRKEIAALRRLIASGEYVPR